MILAAGLGTRLRPLTDTMPKPLLPVSGRPLILWNLLLLRRYGVTEVIINLHHLGHLIEQELGDGSQLGLRISYSREPVLLGTGGGLKQAAPFFDGRPFLVLNGDTLLELDLGEVARFHERRDGVATLVLREDPEVARWGTVEVDERQRILSINGRGRPAGGPSATIRRRMFAGVHVVDPRVLRDIQPGRNSSIIEAYLLAIERGEPLFGYEMTGYWSDVGTPERYAQAQRDAGAGLIDLASRASLLRS